MGVPWGSVGFRGVPRLSILLISPFSFPIVAIFYPSGEYHTFRNRRNVRHWGRKGEEETGRAKGEKRRQKVGFKGGIPPYGRSVEFRGVPWGSAVGGTLCPSFYYLSPRCHIPSIKNDTRRIRRNVGYPLPGKDKMETGIGIRKRETGFEGANPCS